MTDKEKIDILNEVINKFAESPNPHEHDLLFNALKEIKKDVERKNEMMSKDLEEVSKNYLKPKLDKSYENYGDGKMMELTRFDGYDILEAIEFGANWQKEQMKVKNFIDSLPEESKCGDIEMEADFIHKFIDTHNRKPMFLDAIDYGYRKAIDKACDWIYNGMVNTDQLAVRLREAMEG